MDPIAAMKAIQTFGPYSLVVFIGIAYWYKDNQLNKERKDRDASNAQMTQQLLAIIEANTEANVKLESAIDNLSNGLTGLQAMIMKMLKLA